MKKSLTINYLYNVAYKILSLITPLITIPYISRVLGVNNVGIYNYTYSVVCYFTLFGVLGLQMYGQREIAYRNNNKEERDKLFWELVWIRIVTVGIALICYISYSWNTEYKLYYLIFSIELLSNLLDISWFYYAIEDFKLITIRNFIVKLIGVICIFMFVKTNEDLPIYIFCNTIVLFLGNLSVWFGIKSKIKSIHGLSFRTFRHLKYAFIFFIPQCLDSIYMLMDRVMLGNLSTIDQVGIYGQADKIIKMIVTIVTSLGLVVSPRIAQCFYNNDKSGIQKYMYKSFAFTFSIGLPLAGGLICIAPIFSIWFFGIEYNGVAEVLSLLSPVIIFMGINSIIGWQYLMTVKKENIFIKSIATGALVNFVLNIILIRKFNAYGAVFASNISMLIMSVMNFISIRDIVSLKKVLSFITKPFIATIVMVFIEISISSYIKENIIGTFVQVTIGAIVYLLTIYFIKDDFIRPYITNMLNKIKNVNLI